jgi:hypothetical protein
MATKLNNYEIRKNYIDKVGKLLLDYQQKGYLIFNEYGEIVVKIEQRGFGDEFGLRVDHFVIYSYDFTHDNGYYTPLKKLKETMSHFKIVHPDHIVKLPDR